MAHQVFDGEDTCKMMMKGKMKVLNMVDVQPSKSFFLELVGKQVRKATRIERRRHGIPDDVDTVEQRVFCAVPSAFHDAKRILQYCVDKLKNVSQIRSLSAQGITLNPEYKA